MSLAGVRLCLCALSLAWLPAAEAAVVYLKDGSRIQGTVVGATARDVQLHTPDGLLRIGIDRVARIDYEDAATPSAPAGPAPPAAPAVPDSQPALLYKPEYSQAERGDHEVSVDIGISAPLSDINFDAIGGGAANNGDVGAVLGLEYLYHTSSRLGLGFDMEWLHRGASDSSSLLSNADASVYGNSLLLMGVAKYRFTDSGAARPYVSVGAGGHRTSTVIEAAPSLGFAWSDTDTSETRRLIDGHAWGWAGTARVGVDFQVFRPSVFAVEAGWTSLSAATYAATSAGQALGLDDVSGPIQILTVSARWGWRFR